MTLSPHERRILALYQEGDTLAEITIELHLGAEAANTTLRSARRKLGAVNSRHAILVAQQRGELPCRCARTQATDTLAG